MNRLKRLSNMGENISLTNKIKQLQDIGEHKIFVIKCCNLLAQYLLENGREKDALDIMKRGFSHDMSKLSEQEFYGMAEFADDMKSLKNSKEKISPEKEFIINIHRDNNKHHPEYWDNINDMTELDIMELACDWCARSEQFGTDVIEFLETRQETQFHFPKEIYNNIETYLKIIVKLIKKER